MNTQHSLGPHRQTIDIHIYVILLELGTTIWMRFNKSSVSSLAKKGLASVSVVRYVYPRALQGLPNAEIRQQPTLPNPVTHIKIAASNRANWPFPLVFLPASDVPQPCPDFHKFLPLPSLLPTLLSFYPTTFVWKRIC